MAGEAFTSFAKFGGALSMLNGQDQLQFAAALQLYGALGIEPTLPYPLDAMFELVREDIDNSKMAREAGKRGGRPKAAKALQKAETDGLRDGETTVIAEPKPKPNQTKPNQTSKDPIGRRFAPPAREEMREFAAQNGLPDLVDEYFDHFEANGWRVGGKAPMRDARAAYRNWCRRAPQFARGAQQGEAVGDEYASL